MRKYLRPTGSRHRQQQPKLCSLRAIETESANLDLPTIKPGFVLFSYCCFPFMPKNYFTLLPNGFSFRFQDPSREAVVYGPTARTTLANKNTHSCVHSTLCFALPWIQLHSKTFILGSYNAVHVEQKQRSKKKQHHHLSSVDFA